MANKNFVVHNGLTVGNATIDASTGNINTTGTIITQDLQVTGNISVEGSLFDSGTQIATVSDTTAIVIALS